MTKWLENVTNDLKLQDEISLVQLAAAINIICCASKLKTRIDHIDENTCVALVKLVALSPGGNDYSYLKSLMTSQMSWLVALMQYH